MAEADQEFVEMIVKAIVDNPADVSTVRSVDERGVLIELTVNPEDMGKIIGKEGKTAKSIRTLLRVLGAKSNARVNLKIVEPEGSTGPTRKDEDSVDAPKEEVSEAKEEEAKEEVTEAPAEEKVEDEDDDIPTDVLA
jgi:predicted RNA-binding protein YlqC (UPF0109 family)